MRATKARSSDEPLKYGPRRDNNSGSITSRMRGGKVQWIARWPVAPTIRSSGYIERVATSEREARLRLKELRDEYERGVFTPGGEQTLAVYLDWWMESSVRPHCTPKTVVGYDTNIRLHICPLLGQLALARLTRANVQQMVNTLIDRGLAPRTTRYAHATLRAALSDAVDHGFITSNVAARVKLPTISRQEARALNVDQLRDLLAAVQGHRLEALYRLVIALGLREAELCGLRWSDLDLERGRIVIRQQIYRAAGRLHTRETKGHRSRPLVLPPSVSAALRHHRDLQARERQLADDRWQEHGLVFPTSRGTPMFPRNLLRHFQNTLARLNDQRRRAWREAGQMGEPPDLFPRFTFHELRHTTASLLHQQGVSLKAASEILGHAQISLTADIYSHLYDSTREETAQRMDGLLRRLAPDEPPTELSEL